MPADGAGVPNDVLLLETRLSQKKALIYPTISNDDFFLISSVDNILKHRRMSYQQIENGIVDGADDGGIDAVYTFLNGVLVEDEQGQSAERPTVELEIIQAKNERGFKEIALQRLLDHLPLLLRLDANSSLGIEFNERVLERFNIFRRVYLQNSHAFPDLVIRIRYITKSVDPPNPKIAAKEGRLREALRSAFRDAIVEVDYLGAVELNDHARERLSTTTRLRIAEGPMSADKGGLICLVSLKEWYQFITEADTGTLREDMFEENVRGYEGATTINKGIGASLGQGDDTAIDFWWLNNGATVLAEKVRPENKTLVISDPQIVNGLQTSRSIHAYFSGLPSDSREGEARKILVRVIQAQDDAVVSQVIKATNSQNRVSVASLRATEPIQRKIEDYLHTRGYFYDRKKNQHKNSGVARAQIVEVLELAQAVSAILLGEPHTARSRPSALVRDPYYGKVFSQRTPLAALLSCVLIVRRIDAFLESKSMTRPDRGNVRFQLARAATVFALRSSLPRGTAVAKLDVDMFDDDHLELVYQWVLGARETARKTMGTDDLNTLAKGPEWTREMARIFSRYTDKTRWPKKITSDWLAS